MIPVWHRALFATGLGMVQVTRQYDRAGIAQPDQQCLVAWCVTWSGNKLNGTIAKQVVVTIDQ